MYKAVPERPAFDEPVAEGTDDEDPDDQLDRDAGRSEPPRGAHLSRDRSVPRAQTTARATRGCPPCLADAASRTDGVQPRPVTPAAGSSACCGGSRRRSRATTPITIQITSRSHVSFGRPAISPSETSAESGATTQTAGTRNGRSSSGRRIRSARMPSDTMTNAMQRADAHELAEDVDRREPGGNRDDDAGDDGGDVRRAELAGGSASPMPAAARPSPSHRRCAAAPASSRP